MHNEIRKYIRKKREKRAFYKVKRLQNIQLWNQYNAIRNKTTNLLRNAKTHLAQTLASKFKHQTLTTSDYWKNVKQFHIDGNKQTHQTLMIMEIL